MNITILIVNSREMMVRTPRLFVVSFQKRFIFYNVCGRELYACECICPWRTEVSDGADNIGTCQPPAMGAGN